MNAVSKQRTIFAGSLALLILSIIISGIFFGKNRSINENLDKEKLKSEMILSEKLLLEKEIVGLRDQMIALKGTNTEINKILEETSRKLSQKEAEFKKISHENANVRSLKKQLAEITQLKKDLENQLNSINSTVAKLNSENEQLNKTIADLRSENSQLAENLRIVSSITADNFLVETTKGKGKLTVKAKRTNQIAVTFKVPNNLTESLTFRITKPDGTVVKGDDKSISLNPVDDDETLFASINTDEIKVSRKVEMVYKPKGKLKSGIYQIEIFNGDKYVGSSNVRLR